MALFLLRFRAPLRCAPLLPPEPAAITVPTAAMAITSEAAAMARWRRT